MTVNSAIMGNTIAVYTAARLRVIDAIKAGASLRMRSNHWPQLWIGERSVSDRFSLLTFHHRPNLFNKRRDTPQLLSQEDYLH
jgi:hypothetical protein